MHALTGASTLGLTPACDRLVQPRDVVAQGNPDLVIVDAMIGVGGSSCLDDLIRQLGGNSPSRPMTARPPGAAGVRCPSAVFQGSQVQLLHRLLQPDLPEGCRLLWSQIHGLGPNVVVPRLEGAPRDDVNSNAQEFLKILEQADVIGKGGAWLEIDQ
jgi:hypothetical protein